MAEIDFAGRVYDPTSKELNRAIELILNIALVMSEAPASDVQQIRTALMKQNPTWKVSEKKVAAVIMKLQRGKRVNQPLAVKRDRRASAAFGFVRVYEPKKSELVKEIDSAMRENPNAEASQIWADVMKKNSSWKVSEEKVGAMMKLQTETNPESSRRGSLRKLLGSGYRSSYSDDDASVSSRGSVRSFFSRPSRKSVVLKTIEDKGVQDSSSTADETEYNQVKVKELAGNEKRGDSEVKDAVANKMAGKPVILKKIMPDLDSAEETEPDSDFAEETEHNQVKVRELAGNETRSDSEVKDAVANKMDGNPVILKMMSDLVSAEETELDSDFAEETETEVASSDMTEPGVVSATEMGTDDEPAHMTEELEVASATELDMDEISAQMTEPEATSGNGMDSDDTPAKEMDTDDTPANQEKTGVFSVEEMESKDVLPEEMDAVPTIKIEPPIVAAIQRETDATSAKEVNAKIHTKIMFAEGLEGIVAAEEEEAQVARSNDAHPEQKLRSETAARKDFSFEQILMIGAGACVVAGLALVGLRVPRRF